MFLEKHTRFLRLYDLRMSPRHSGAAFLPLDAGATNFSVRDAFDKRIKAGLALVVQPNGDIVELMSAAFNKTSNALVLLFHRASPNAAEPTYRKKARAEAGVRVTLRQSQKEPGEEQSVSAHLVIGAAVISQGVYRAALEEIPGINMGLVRQILGTALGEYKYGFARGKKNLETHTVLKPEGLKSESITNALKKGSLDYVTLTRVAKPDFVDADGIFKPQTETMRLKVEGKITDRNWRQELAKLVGAAKGEGWEKFNLDLGLEHDRRRTVELDREADAKEVLFVRSELVAVKRELPTCSVDISTEIVAKFAAAIAESKKG